MAYPGEEITVFRPMLFTVLAASLSILGTGCSDNSSSSATTEAPIEPVAVEEEELCFLPVEDIEISATEAGIEFVRTPDACFEGLSAYPFEPNYVEVEGLRVHYVDEGPADGQVVLMLHGQPSWSYLYRKMLPVLVDAGFRVIAPDHVGLGRSDKPTDPRVHSYDQQVAWNQQFVSELGLSDITIFVQDWGSLIGLRMVGENPELYARAIVANGNIPAFPAGANPFTVPVFEFDSAQPDAETFFANRSEDPVQGFQEWIDYAASAADLFAGDLLQIGTAGELSDEELAAYDAPYPDPLYWGAIRSFPSMLVGIEQQTVPAIQALGRFDRPFLALAGEFDLSLGSEAVQNGLINLVPGSRGQDHRRYEAGHFIQEDVGSELAAQLVEFIEATPIPEAGPVYAARYCEILLVSTPGGVIEATVYNSLGLNGCPQAEWDALDEAAVAEEFMAVAAIKNGPRAFLMDVLEPADSADAQPVEGAGTIETFGGIDMRLLAVVRPSGGMGTTQAPYEISEVVRDTIYTFVRGRRIYELEDPEGTRYIMQSLSQIVDPNLQIHDLIDLEERLELPAGWSYHTRILLEDLILLSNGLAQVLVDDFSNTYQRIE
ncbi:MAG: haloalkane dehalogenase [Pseudomonadota bacterium]